MVQEPKVEFYPCYAIINPGVFPGFLLHPFSNELMPMKYFITAIIICLSFGFCACSEDEDSSLSKEAKAQIDNICQKEYTCNQKPKSDCTEERTTFYKKLAGSKCEKEFMALQDCSLNLSCENYPTKLGCETEQKTYADCEGISGLPEPL